MLDKWKEIYEFNKNGWFNYEDVYDMASELKITGDFVEIGVWQGMSYTYLALKNPKRTVWGVDTFKGDPLNSEEQRRIKKDNLDLLKIFQENCRLLEIQPNIIQKESSSAADIFDTNTLAFIFVDGGHSYEQVYKDLSAWYIKLKFGGIIGGHDYDSPGVEKAVAKFFGNDTKIKTNNGSWWVRK